MALATGTPVAAQLTGIVHPGDGPELAVLGNAYKGLELVRQIDRLIANLGACVFSKEKKQRDNQRPFHHKVLHVFEQNRNVARSPGERLSPGGCGLVEWFAFTHVGGPAKAAPSRSLAIPCSSPVAVNCPDYTPDFFFLSRGTARFCEKNLLPSGGPLALSLAGRQQLLFRHSTASRGTPKEQRPFYGAV